MLHIHIVSALFVCLFGQCKPRLMFFLPETAESRGLSVFTASSVFSPFSYLSFVLCYRVKAVSSCFDWIFVCGHLEPDSKFDTKYIVLGQTQGKKKLCFCSTVQFDYLCGEKQNINACEDSGKRKN